MQRWFPDGTTAVTHGTAPVVHFDRDDDLQGGWLRRRTPGQADPRAHHVPSTEGFLETVLAGMRWAMLSDLALAAVEVR